MFQIEPQPLEDMMKVARAFQRKPVNYEFNILEERALHPFFTNQFRATYFLFNLPSTIGTALLAMFSRMKNPRGVRGSWVDSFLPQLLASQTEEVKKSYEANPLAKGVETAYLKMHGIKDLAGFTRFSLEHHDLFEEFIGSVGNPVYYQKLAESSRARVFLEQWLDKFGHNSIARMGSIWLCCERISLMAAKSLEWSRLGTGFIELSTRYVDMGGKEVYPIAEMLEAGYGCDKAAVDDLQAILFGEYKRLFGTKVDGILPTFLRRHYARTFRHDIGNNLEIGVGGETSDVLGNLLPLSTLTEVAIASSGEAFPGILKHLMLDGTPENLALIEAIIEEAPKVGADSYARHWQPTPSEVKAWTYLSHKGEPWCFLQADCTPVVLTGQLDTQAIQDVFDAKPHGKSRPPKLTEIVADLYSEGRQTYEKLPREFESASATFLGIMTMRGWRDLHRMSIATHRRSLVTPSLGFYRYDKPAPAELDEAFLTAAATSRELYESLDEVPAFLRQYFMPMGWNVSFVYGANLRQMEFSIWQRTKASVNHEVRQIFMAMNDILASHLSWWKKASRACFFPVHKVRGYIFARSANEVGKPLRRKRKRA